MKYLSFMFLAVLLSLIACNTVSEEILGTGNIEPPDSTGFYSVTAAGVTLQYRVNEGNLHCILSANTEGWIAVGFDPTNMMQDANFLIGYVQAANTFMRDDWGTGNTTHASDTSLGGTDDVTIIAGSETDGITELEFSLPLDSGDQYDRVLELDQSYTIILARGNSDDFSSFHIAADYATISLEESGGGGNGGSGTYVLPDTTQYLSLQAQDIIFYWLVEQDSLHCVLKAPVTGWIGIGFDPENIMQNANFIMGYVQDSVAYFSDEWGVGPTSHSADVDLGGTYDIGSSGGFDDAHETILYFSIPLDSGDSYDKQLVPDNTYSLILAYGNADNFVGTHSTAAISSFTVDNETGGGDNGVTTGGHVSGDDDTEGFHVYAEDDYFFKWKVVGDSLRCMVFAMTTGWVAVGFDPDVEMLNANLIIGYVQSGTAYVRDDWGVSETSHTADVVLGGENNVTRVFGEQIAGSTEIRFTIPLNSEDNYDKVLVPGNTYEIILAYGFAGDDNFSGMHQEEEDFEIDL